MIVQAYFTSANRTLMDGVWKEVFNVFVDLTGISNSDNPNNLRYNIKLERFLFLNIIKTLYNELNNPNSKCLVDDFYNKLNPTVILDDNICYALAGGGVVSQRDHLTEYERNIIFGGLYFVLVRTIENLADKSVVEKVKSKLSYKRNPGIHYFNYFVDKLSEEPQIEEDSQTTKKLSEPIVELPYSKEEKQQLYKEIKAFKNWLDKNIQYVRTQIDLGYMKPVYLSDYAIAKDCLDKCTILLCKDSDAISTEEVQAKSGIDINHIREFVCNYFPSCHEEYKDRYTYPHPTTQHAQEAEIVEEVTPIPTTQPTQEHIVESINTDVTQPTVDTPDPVEEESLKLQRREQALALLLSCKEYFKSETTDDIVKKAYNKLCEKMELELDKFLAAQSFLTTVCRMIGVIKEEKLLKTTVNQTIASHIAKKNNLKNAETIAAYIGKTKNTSQKDLLKKWREYLQENMQK